MSNYGPYRVHWLADKFPLLTGEEFVALVESIGKNGLQEKIVLLADGKTIVDGRNRYLGCDAARVDPAFRVLPEFYTEEQIVDFIIAANLRRRNLTVSQRAALAVEIEEELAKTAQHGGPRPIRKDIEQGADPSTLEDTIAKKSRTKAAIQVDVSGASVQQAKAIKAMAPRLFLQLVAGTTNLNDAYKTAKKQEKARKEGQPMPENDRPGPIRRTVTLVTHLGEEVEYPLPKSAPTFNPTNEHISWAAWSWNPVTGCLHGCRYCYARELAERDSYAASYPVGFTPLFHHERLSAPHNTPVPDSAICDRRRGRVFVCSMADLYGQWVPDEWIERVHAACIANPQWEYMMLTKFPARYNRIKLPPTAWIGTSVDEQKRVRIAEDAFRSIRDVRVKWLSLEPLLAPLAFTDLSMFDWIVIGSQTATEQPSGPVPSFAPPFEWVARLVAQAREAGCKVYLKPNLIGPVNPQSPGMTLPQEDPLQDGPLPPNVLPLRQRA